MRRSHLAAAIFILLAGPAAYADTFNVNADFFRYEPGCVSCGTGSLTGTETIDTSKGVITDASLTATLDGVVYTFSGAPVDQLADPNSAIPDDPKRSPLAYVAKFSNGTEELDLNLYIGLTGTLVGYTGGDVCGMDVINCSPGNQSYEGFLLNGGEKTYLNQGTLTEAQVAVTPEPSGFALLCTGLLGVAGALRRRIL
ncbi:PEP-CTERM sorting domain-containing protein [Terriglobus saanensis]|uniref:PEP-CTERM protein-sorting domain-containing protein n=1 Tax=Terriglobus saanensis (strain ATCC BAA-1853 / DSM 23119 / SP1PR4) TaxID=401053 RepID=E8UY64_TERSS|nr:PEP-CTERM sorting domain-containing protein [Terriglobus saanensis]ADV80874.1 protein of unknown function DUF1555 [Terriglobus saanensis SP1PR4]